MPDQDLFSSESQSDKEIALKQALRKAGDTIRQLLQENAALKKKERIAIIGMACRFPGGANSIEEYWSLLESGKDAISEFPFDRRNKNSLFYSDDNGTEKLHSVKGGFLNTSIDQFDAAFFGISPDEAKSLDPQQRLLLELGWEALEHARLIPEHLKSTRTAVYIGSSNSTAGIISRTFGFTGPSLALDTACSSSLVALHLATRSLHALESDMAMVGGVNLIIDPDKLIAHSKPDTISPDGACRVFSADANGYVRSEGCAVIILKRESDAKRDGDNILAYVCGTAINQDGKTDEVDAPNGQSQQAVIHAALNDAGIESSQLDYIEAHGIGTLLGDPIELEAIGNVMHNRSQSVLNVGSSKSNIGHMESVAGLGGLIKIVLSLQHKKIPANLHFNIPNTQLDWDNLPMKVVATHTDWPLKSNPNASRYAGLSSFGFGGTNAHIVISGNDVTPVEVIEKPERPMHVLTLSARSEQSLIELAHRYAHRIKNTSSSELADVCFSSNTTRSQFEFRFAVNGANSNAMVKKLNNLKSVSKVTRQTKTAWLFSGQGSEYPGMGLELYQSLPIFKQTIDQCAVILDRILPLSLIEILFDPDKNHLLETQFAHPAIFALEYSLAKTWLSWGVRPDYVAGNDIGEYVAACIAEIFSLEDGLLMLAARAKVLQNPPDHVVMAELETFLNSIRFSSPSIPFISGSSAGDSEQEFTQSTYWMQHIGKHANLIENINRLTDLSVRTFLEIGPDQSIIEYIRSHSSTTNDLTLCSSLHRNSPPWEVLTSTVAQLYMHGIQIDWNAFDAPYKHRKVDLPTYAFDRKRYWIDESHLKAKTVQTNFQSNHSTQYST